MGGPIAWIEPRLAERGVSRTLFALALAQCVAAFGAGLIVPLLAPLLVTLEDPLFPESVYRIPVTTELQVGILFSVFGIVRSVFEIPMGRLSDRVGVRKLFLEMGLTASGFCVVAYTIATTVSGMLTVRVLQGFALAISTPALMAMIEGITEHRTRGGSMGFFDTLRTLGWGVGPIVGGAITDLVSMRAAFLTGGALLFVAVGAVHLFVPEVKPLSDATGSSAAASNPTGPSRDVLSLFSSRAQATSLLGLSLALVTLTMGFSAMIAMENPILDRIGGTKAGFGIVFAITTLVRLVVQFPVGVASDAYGRKRFIVWGLVANAPLVGLMGFASSLWEFTALRALQGVALAGVISPTFALAADVVDERHSAQQMGVVSAAFSVGLAVGPILAGAVAFLGFAVPFLVAAALTVIGAFGAWLAVDEYGASA